MLDGEEIDQTISWKSVINDTGDGSHGAYCIYFNMLSDPTKVDTDGDGFGDSQDPNAKTYDLSIDSETATAIVNFMYDYLGLVMPPVYNNAGEKITAKNKECEETKAYFDEYLWPYLKDVEMYDSIIKNVEKDEYYQNIIFYDDATYTIWIMWGEFNE